MPIRWMQRFRAPHHPADYRSHSVEVKRAYCRHIAGTLQAFCRHTSRDRKRCNKRPLHQLRCPATERQRPNRKRSKTSAEATAVHRRRCITPKPTAAAAANKPISLRDPSGFERLACHSVWHSIGFSSALLKRTPDSSRKGFHFSGKNQATAI